MALEFKVVSLKKDLNNRHYVARIEFQGREGDYEMYTNAHIYHYDRLGVSFNILDGNDYAFNKNNLNGEELYFRIRGMDSVTQRLEKELEKAILKFIREECCEKS